MDVNSTNNREWCRQLVVSAIKQLKSHIWGHAACKMIKAKPCPLCTAVWQKIGDRAKVAASLFLAPYTEHR